MTQVILRDSEQHCWLVFNHPRAVVQTDNIAAVRSCLARVERAVNEEGLFAAGFLAYEAAPAFDAALRVKAPLPDQPLLWFGLFSAPERLQRLPSPPGRGYTLGVWRPGIDWPSYAAAITRIKAFIARGHTYQVNYTFPLRTTFQGDPWHFFLDLQRAQQAPFAAYIDLGAWVICSASPELFFSLHGEKIVSRPMKGTAARGYNLEDDNRQSQWLQLSEKNRAENVMIVDMIRNDLGRIATTGSVHVPRLFEVERYPTVFQMTSTVAAQTSAPVTTILPALFPCASITGAPKVRTMEIIAELETSPRGVYTGAIGMLAPGRRAQFNVAIRTVTVDRGRGEAIYGVGGGIVWDSLAADEYQECRLKAGILSDPPPAFDLLESLLWEPESGYFLLERHLHRLAQAAEYFCIPLSHQEVQEALQDLARDLPSCPHKVRVLVSQTGAVRCGAAPLDAQTTGIGWRVGLARKPVSSTHPFLYFKTTQRRVYEEALASRPDCDDVLLWNERGELTESSRANVVVRFKGRWYTPPLSCGLLAGTYRAELLARGEIRERVIRVDELPAAEELSLINSVRRWVRTEWVELPEMEKAPGR